jgi:hypothetical protein
MLHSLELRFECLMRVVSDDAEKAAEKWVLSRPCRLTFASVDHLLTPNGKSAKQPVVSWHLSFCHILWDTNKYGSGIPDGVIALSLPYCQSLLAAQAMQRTLLPERPSE